MAGKHVANSAGKRAAGGGRSGFVLLGLLAAVLAAYVGLCVWVSVNGKVLPNVTVAGLDVSGMTVEEAQSAMELAVQEYSDDASITLTYGDWSGTMCVADYQHEPIGGGVLAYGVGRENFFVQGFQFLRHLLGGSTEVELNLTHRAEQTVFLDLLNEADRAMGSEVSQMSYSVRGDQLEVTKGRSGVKFDGAMLLYVAQNAVEDALEQAIAQGEEANVIVDLESQDIGTEITPPYVPEYELLHHELYAEVVEPTYDKQTGTVTDHTVGIDFDVKALQSAYEAAAEGETFSIPLTVTQPKDTKEAYEKKLFADVLGTATSKVSGSANRKSNVKLSAAACNGVILLPGEEFSYNNTTGSRSPDKGYLPAPTYNAGASVDDVGGGICQTSSTIYYALLHTTLEVVERQNHSYATGYVPDGMDATVFFGSLDFRFKNNTNYPVKVVTESYDKSGNRYLKVTLMGTNEDGRYAKPTNSVYEVVEPTKSYVADETVPQGTLVLDKQQNAYRGRKAQVTRTIYEADGTVVEQQNMGVSRYKMRPHLYHYNPLDGDPATWPDGVPPQPVPVTPVVPETPAETTQPTVPEVPTEPAPETQSVPA